jgi:hypothetical protein
MLSIAKIIQCQWQTNEQVMNTAGMTVTPRKTHPSAAETLNLEQQVTCLMSETIIM